MGPGTGFRFASESGTRRKSSPPAGLAAPYVHDAYQPRGVVGRPQRRLVLLREGGQHPELVLDGKIWRERKQVLLVQGTQVERDRCDVRIDREHARNLLDELLQDVTLQRSLEPETAQDIAAESDPDESSGVG